MKTDIKKYIAESIRLHESLLPDDLFISSVEKASKVIFDCLKRGRKVLIAGNGGSAADAQHFAAELVARYKLERKGYPVIALTTDSSILTAWSNDYSFDSVFERQVEAFGSKKDVFIGISTSGNSKNIILAMKKAKELGMETIVFLGGNGGKLKATADVTILAPSNNTPRIQEIHAMIVHIISEEVEKQLVQYGN